MSQMQGVKFVRETGNQKSSDPDRRNTGVLRTVALCAKLLFPFLSAGQTRTKGVGENTQPGRGE